MNFLQLCQAVAREIGVSEPTTTVSQTGDSKRIVEWVKRAWLDIQSDHHNWDFLWMRTEFDTVSGVTEYNPATTVKTWDQNSFSIFLKSDGEGSERSLPAMLYSEYKTVDLGTSDDGYPNTVVVLPSNYLLFDPTPGAVYTVQCNYWKNPVELSANTDTPASHAQYHNIIVDKALEYYYLYEQDTALYQGANLRFQEGLSRMRQDYLPQLVVKPSPLA